MRDESGLVENAGGADALRVRVEDLLTRWGGLGRTHVVLSVGCSCGFAGAHVSAAEFEVELVSFLQAKWGAERALQPVLATSPAGIEAFLRALLAADAPADVGPLLFEDMAKAINSFAPPRRLFRAEAV